MKGVQTMRNIDWLNKENKLTQFVIDYAKLAAEEDYLWFEEKYGIPNDTTCLDWLFEEHKEKPLQINRKANIGSRVYKPLMRTDGKTFDLYGTVTRIVIDAKGEHVYVNWDDIESFKTVNWDDIESFKTMETLGKDVFIAE